VDAPASSWSDRIDALVRAGGPRIVYQPIVELFGSWRTVGYEALSRFEDSTPDEWFEAADLHGRTVDLEASALRAALVGLDEVPHGLYLSVNASERLIAQPEFAEALAGHDLSRLQVEITERTVVVDYDAVMDRLAPFRAAGMHLAVDDFATAFATLRLVVRVRPDVFKADRWMVRGIETQRGWPERAALSSLVQLASRLGVSIVQEGIETEEQATAVYLLGVDYGQGYLFGQGRAL
jgi:EAL domain-containing protein (putative c-di-GMP-specific phosphodiesterase class I)